MYIRRVKLTNIRLFRELDISFVDKSDGLKRWTILLGDNATGKSTLLRCIAIGLCDESGAASLVRELKGELGRERVKIEPRILIELDDLKGRLWTIRTALRKIKRTGELVRQDTYPFPIDEYEARDEATLADSVEEFPFPSIFVVGYGAGRSPEGREEYESYRNVDAVYTLFRYDQPLQSPELAWRRLRDTARSNPKRGTPSSSEQRTDERIRELLRDVLCLGPDESVLLGSRGIEVVGSDGSKTSLSSHADGYKATTTWVLDLIAWRIHFQRGLDPKTMSGIVLLDEIEQHLHPRWQRYIVARLSFQFPRIQFIATTHSPLCAASAADLEKKDCQIISLKRAHRAVDLSYLDLPQGLRADQILTMLFDMDETRNPKIGERVARYRELFRIEGRSKDEEKELKALIVQLRESVPEIGQFEDERALRDELKTYITEIEESCTRRGKND